MGAILVTSIFLSSGDIPCASFFDKIRIERGEVLSRKNDFPRHW
jgi:hypothetical protein